MIATPYGVAPLILKRQCPTLSSPSPPAYPGCAYMKLASTPQTKCHQQNFTKSIASNIDFFKADQRLQKVNKLFIKNTNNRTF